MTGSAASSTNTPERPNDGRRFHPQAVMADYLAKFVVAEVSNQDWDRRISVIRQTLAYAREAPRSRKPDPVRRRPVGMDTNTLALGRR